MFNWIKIFSQGGKGPMDSTISVKIQYVSGTVDGSSCDQEAFAILR